MMKKLIIMAMISFLFNAPLFGLVGYEINFTSDTTLTEDDSYYSVGIQGDYILDITGGVYHAVEGSPTGSPTINIYDGLIIALSGRNNSILNIYGGEFPFDQEGALSIEENVIVNIYGYNLKINPIRVSGIWANGKPFAIYFQNNPWEILSTNIILHETPPSMACVYPIDSDLNNDCRVNILDFEIFASEWMSCGLAEQTACWS